MVLSGIAGISALAWVYLIYLAWQMEAMGMEMAMPRMEAWGALDLLLMFVMWAVMMVGMMAPSASPMVLMFARLNRKRREEASPVVPTGVFLFGYLLAWGGFSLAATGAQWGLNTAAMLSPTMATSSPVLGGALLMGAGIYQWTPLKYACLKHCRSPLNFMMTSWREGTGGAVMMGLHHGAYCVGCCSVLMALLFVAGIMNLLWVAVIAVFVLLEKVLPRGDWVGRLAGLSLIAWGGWMAAAIFL